MIERCGVGRFLWDRHLPLAFSVRARRGKRRKATKGCYSFTSIAFFASLSLRQDVRYCVNILVASDTDSPSSSTARQKSCGVCCCSRRLDTPLARLICDSLKTGYCRLLRISDWGEGNVRCVVPVNTVEWLLCCSNQPWSSLSFLCRCVSVSLPSAWGLSCLGSECQPSLPPFPAAGTIPWLSDHLPEHTPEVSQPQSSATEKRAVVPTLPRVHTLQWLDFTWYTTVINLGFFDSFILFYRVYIL